MSFRFIPIENPNAAQSAGDGTQVFGISSNTGVIVGAYSTGVGDNEVGFADFLGSYINLPGPVGATDYVTTGVNDNGSFIGASITASGAIGYLDAGGLFTTLSDPKGTSTLPKAINDFGKIVGYYVGASLLAHAFTYSGGTFSDLTVPGALSSAALGINASGQITGYYIDASDNVHGFLDTGGVFTTLDVPGAGMTEATGINDKGQILGAYTDADDLQHGFVYSSGRYTTFNVPGIQDAAMSPWGISNSGLIAGYYVDDADRAHGFVLGTSTPHDFYGLNTADVLWRSGGGLSTWDMQGSTISASAPVTYQGQLLNPDASWNVAATADFNGDGAADMLWRQDGTGALSLWQMQGSTVTASQAITSNGSAITPDASWSVDAAGDFNADSCADLLWRQGSTGALALWSMDGAAVVASKAVTSNGSAVTPDASWNVAGIGDFNGDGYTDMLWRQTSGALSMWDMNGSKITSSSPITSQGNAVTPDASWTIAGVGDFDNDGQADVLWRQNTGTLELWQMNGSSVAQSSAITSQGNAVAPDASWKLVEIGDFDGDGKTDLLWRNDNGSMAEWLMDGAKITASVAPTSQGNAVSPDASWSVQGQPTMFA